MVTKEDLEKRYNNLSNEELLEIIENKFGALMKKYKYSLRF